MKNQQIIDFKRYMPYCDELEIEQYIFDTINDPDDCPCQYPYIENVSYLLLQVHSKKILAKYRDEDGHWLFGHSDCLLTMAFESRYKLIITETYDLYLKLILLNLLKDIIQHTTLIYLKMVVTKYKLVL